MKTSDSPLISVCMCAYDAEEFIGAAIESVLLQTLQRFELIVVNDGSSDRTVEVVESYVAKDSRIRLVSHVENYGLIAARNRSFAESKADLLAIADADDLLHPQRLEKQYQLLTLAHGTGVVGSAVEFFGQRHANLPHQELVREDADIRFAMRFQPAFWNTTTLYVRECVQAVGGYRTGFERGAEDYDLWARLMQVTRFANHPAALVRVRLHPSSVTSGNDDCLENILRISADMLGDYLQSNVSCVARRAYQRFMMQQGISTPEYREAIALMELLVPKISASEPEDVQTKYFRKLRDTCFVHAMYLVYRNPLLSDDLYHLSQLVYPQRLLSWPLLKFHLQRIRRVAFRPNI